jgi:quinol monooxygenase YgiN
MTRIAADQSLVTLINVFTVAPERQQQLVDLLDEATRTTMVKLDGFISASIHKSLDGVRVTNYAQWRSRADFEAMLRHPEAIPHMQACAALAESVEPHLYDVASVHNRP